MPGLFRLLPRLPVKTGPIYIDRGDYHNVQGGKVPVRGDCHGPGKEEHIVKMRNVGLGTKGPNLR